MLLRTFCRSAFFVAISCSAVLVGQPVSASPGSSSDIPSYQVSPDLSLSESPGQATDSVVLGAPDPAPADPAIGASNSAPAPNPAQASNPAQAAPASSGTITPLPVPPGAAPVPSAANAPCSGAGQPQCNATAPLASGAPGNTGSGGNALTRAAGSTFMESINDGAIRAAVGEPGDKQGGVLGYVMNDVLGSHAVAFNPVVSCRDLPPDTRQQACGNWFLKQYGLMHQMGVLLIAPLMMLVIIQSVIRGSLFLLLRSTLILLPTAFIGSIVVAGFVQMLLNITDDLSSAMFAASGSDFSKIRDGIQHMDKSTTSWFGLLFLLITLLSALVIIIEMILREVTVYLSVLFMPLAFAGLVWPASSQWAKTSLRTIVGVASAKIYIAGGIALGLGAVEVGAGGTSPSQSGLMAAVNAAAIFLTAGVFGVRLSAWAAGAGGANEGRIANPASVYGVGELTHVLAGNRIGRLGKRKANLKPRVSTF